MNAGLRPNTISSYASDWRVFRAWCEAAQRPALPATAETVELYVTDLIGRGRKITTMQRHAVAIQYMHRKAELASPCRRGLRELLSGARRELCQMPGQKQALAAEDLERMVAAIGSATASAVRNRALVLFGFASALRRANLAALRREDLTFTGEGVIVRVHHEKQDRHGRGRLLPVPAGKHRQTCPVAALQRWLLCRGNVAGTVFCRVLNGRPDGRPILGNRIGQIVQEAARAIGLDPKLYGAHSLRAGFVTEALDGGASEIAVARHTGHRSLDTLRLYHRPRSLFRHSAAAALAL